MQCYFIWLVNKCKTKVRKILLSVYFIQYLNFHQSHEAGGIALLSLYVMVTYSIYLLVMATVCTCDSGVPAGRWSWYSTNQIMETDPSACCYHWGSAETNLLWKMTQTSIQFILHVYIRYSGEFVVTVTLTNSVLSFLPCAELNIMPKSLILLPSHSITGSWCYEIRDQLKDLYSPWRVWIWFSGESST